MSSPNIIKDNKSQSSFEIGLNQTLEELILTFEQMPKPQKAQYAYLCPGPQELITVPAPSQIQLQPMDPMSRLRASKVCNVLLARLWRRRCAEVSDLHELIRKYQQKANKMRDDLFLHHNLICREQQRSDRIELELRRFKKETAARSHNCATIDNALYESRLQESKLRSELESKTQECNNLAELLNKTKTEMFLEFGKLRNCAKELAEQQRQNRLLEIHNAELEDEILTLKDRFQVQHDDIVVAVHMKQEKLDEAYETLKGVEQELAVLELKRNELLRDNQIDPMLQELNRLQHKTGIIRYIMCLQWPNFEWISFEQVAKYLAYMLHNQLSRPRIPRSSTGLCMATVLMIGVIY